MLYDDLISDLREEYIRGPLIDEIFVYLQDQELITLDMTTARTWIRAI
jgi:hypothetical protein